MNKRRGASTSSYPYKLSCNKNTLMGALVCLFVFMTVVLYQSHTVADAALKTQIAELKNSLHEHEELSASESEKVLAAHKDALDSNAGSLVSVKQQLPVLEGAISDMMHDAQSKTDNLGGSISGLESTFHQLSDKLQSLESMIKDHNSDSNMHAVNDGKKQTNSVALRGSSTVVLNSKQNMENIEIKPISNNGGASSLGKDSILLIIASNRPKYLKRCLEKVVKYHPLDGVPIVISEDGEHPEVKKEIENARKMLMDKSKTKSLPVILFQHMHHPASPPAGGNLAGYFALSEHFKWALSHVFGHMKAKRVIILEEDLDIAPDFFEYFGSLAPMLDSDPSLLTISAYNDNGQHKHVKDHEKLYRSDFFPGLGWMMTKNLWSELQPKWPKGFWDDWLREPAQRQGRHTIHPEISRSLHYGKMGVSGGQFQNLQDEIWLNDKFISFSKLDISYVEEKKWDEGYLNSVRESELITREEIDKLQLREKRQDPSKSSSSYRIEYNGNSGFENLAHWAGAMNNIKANVPRTAYKGIVSIWMGDTKVHLTPANFI